MRLFNGLHLRFHHSLRYLNTLPEAFMMHFFWIIILALHLLSISYWVGAAFCTIQMRRSVKLLDENTANNIQLQQYTRFFRALKHVIPIAILTGAGLFFHALSLGAHLPWPYHLMVLCAVFMTALFLKMYIGPFREARRAIRPPKDLFNKLFRYNLGMMMWGIIAIFSAALGHQ